MHHHSYGLDLASLHWDSMDVYRAIKVLREGITYDELQPVAIGVPCRLSKRAAFGANKSGTSAPKDTQVFPDTRDTFTLFTVDFELQKGDRVRVLRGSRIVEGIAGDSYPYRGHRETVLSVHEV